MSKADGWAALQLQMPERIPRTEYSAETHWELVRAVTKLSVDEKSPQSVKNQATNEFIQRWNYDFVWRIVIDSRIFGDMCTKMGHAAYETGGVDFSREVYCPFAEPEDVLKFRASEYFPFDRASTLKMLNDHYRQNEVDYPNAVNMTGSYVTALSGLIELFGWEMLLLAAGVDLDGFGAVAEDYGNFMRQYFECMAECESKVIMVHDDLCWTGGPMLPPAWYRKYLFPNLKKNISILKEAGKKVIFTSDGNYTMFVDDIADCGADGFVLEPLTDLNYVAEKYGKTHVIIGNVDTKVLLLGSKEDIYNEVKRCMDIGRHCAGFFLAVGNHIPSNTPVENALYYNEVYEKLSRR